MQIATIVMTIYNIAAANLLDTSQSINQSYPYSTCTHKYPPWTRDYIYIYIPIYHAYQRSLPFLPPFLPLFLPLFLPSYPQPIRPLTQPLTQPLTATNHASWALISLNVSSCSVGWRQADIIGEMG